MNKKLLTILGVATMALSTGCVQTNNSTNSTPAEDPAKKVLADSEVDRWVVHGPNTVGDVLNGWDDKTAEVFEATTMTATSVEEVGKVSKDVADKLATKNLKYLYTIDVTFGTTDAGWTTRVMRDGKKYDINGSYAFKVGKVGKAEVEVEGENGPELKTVYSTTQWISDPKTAHAESLTPETCFVPTWVEEADENGFNWSMNPAVIGGAGTYTLIAAQYKEVSAADVPGYAFALVKKAEAEAATEDAEVTEFKHEDHTFGLIGDFNGWGADLAMTGTDGSYSCEVELAADQSFKVRLDGEWTTSWGAAALVSSPEGAFGSTDDGNIKCLVAGTYVVTIGNFTASGGAEITITAK